MATMSLTLTVDPGIVQSVGVVISAGREHEIASPSSLIIHTHVQLTIKWTKGAFKTLR
jgi:hypothetical protein